METQAYRVTVIEPDDASEEAAAAAIALAGLGLITIAAIAGIALAVHVATSSEVGDVMETKPIFD